MTPDIGIFLVNMDYYVGIVRILLYYYSCFFNVIYSLTCFVIFYLKLWKLFLDSLNSLLFWPVLIPIYNGS